MLPQGHKLGARRAPHGRKQPACGPGEATATTGHRGHERLQTAPRETPAEPQARKAARGPQGSSPPRATPRGGLTWHQDDRLPLPPVSIVANDVSLLCAAAEGREGQLGPLGPHPSAQAPLLRATCAQSARHLSVHQHGPAHNPTAASPGPPQGPAARLLDLTARTDAQGSRAPTSAGEQLLPPWGQASPRLSLSPHPGRGTPLAPSPTSSAHRAHVWLGWHRGPLAAPDRPTDSSRALRGPGVTSLPLALSRVAQGGVPT